VRGSSTDAPGLLAAAALLSSYLFFWHARLAETDPWATLFVTFGTLAFWKAVAPEMFTGGTDAGARRQAIWFHAGAACVALATLSKGAPALFPLLFLIGLSLLWRRPRALWLFVRCGAPLTMVVPGLLWLGYASRHADLGQIGEEFSNNWRGEGHGAPFFAYFYMLPMAALPWTGVDGRGDRRGGPPLAPRRAAPGAARVGGVSAGAPHGHGQQAAALPHDGDAVPDGAGRVGD
jgi:4-amino-4-deoxy-L-arabinose transferase-like glycosyltransferase